MAKDGQLVKVKASFKLGEKLKKVVKKPAAKKPAAKKPAAKKPAAKKPAAGKVVKKVGCCAALGLDPPAPGGGLQSLHEPAP